MIRLQHTKLLQVSGGEHPEFLCHDVLEQLHSGKEAEAAEVVEVQRTIIHVCGLEEVSVLEKIQVGTGRPCKLYAKI